MVFSHGEGCRDATPPYFLMIGFFHDMQFDTFIRMAVRPSGYFFMIFLIFMFSPAAVRFRGFLFYVVIRFQFSFSSRRGLAGRCVPFNFYG